MKKDTHLTCGTKVKSLEKLLRSDEYLRIHRSTSCTDVQVYPPRLLPEPLGLLRPIQRRMSHLVVLATETRVDSEGVAHRNCPFAWVDEYGYLVLRRNGMYQITPLNELSHHLRPDQQRKLVQDVEHMLGKAIDAGNGDRRVHQASYARHMESIRET